MFRLGTLFLVLSEYIQGNSGGLQKTQFIKRGYIRNTPDKYEYEPYLPPLGGQTINSRGEVGLSQYRPPEQTTELGDFNPVFSAPIHNVTVNVGREAVLECMVTNLRQYKVGWLKAGDQTILALHKRVITHNTRIQVSHEENRIWRLHIRNVEEGDRGCYMCQINTELMKQELGCLDVNVPPDIDMKQTSNDVTVQENYNTTLVCHASGHPTPRIKWRREDSGPLFLNSNDTDYVGDTIALNRVDRKQMGSYLCIASNDVPPAVSKRITLSVSFPPVVYVPNQLIGVRLEDVVDLECRIEAYPNTINYWMKQGKHEQEMLLNNVKYNIEERKDGYKVQMILQIRNLSYSDLGVYYCISTNSLGKTDGSIRLYENPRVEGTPKEITSTTTLRQVLTIEDPMEEDPDWMDSQEETPETDHQTDYEPRRHPPLGFGSGVHSVHYCTLRHLGLVLFLVKSGKLFSYNY
ncbi:lachesin isoform X2 [Eurytemora carolleeae]|uniref:lachesin isoform X2 n=1 Tax=Eurytemora carolleeae TaxID=1294199 RepID=UPI000C769F1F|nr:lachesin isoform X2 [Eurytemora carolleeae]|eukprot:XP_023319725.1 lachesin-like isoform X2 [Eurytemora affinis]